MGLSFYEFTSVHVDACVEVKSFRWWFLRARFTLELMSFSPLIKKVNKRNRNEPEDAEPPFLTRAPFRQSRSTQTASPKWIGRRNFSKWPIGFYNLGKSLAAPHPTFGDSYPPDKPTRKLTTSLPKPAMIPKEYKKIKIRRTCVVGMQRRTGGKGVGLKGRCSQCGLRMVGWPGRRCVNRYWEWLVAKWNPFRMSFPCARWRISLWCGSSAASLDRRPTLRRPHPRSLSSPRSPFPDARTHFFSLSGKRYTHGDQFMFSYSSCGYLADGRLCLLALQVNLALEQWARVKRS